MLYGVSLSIWREVRICWMLGRETQSVSLKVVVVWKKDARVTFGIITKAGWTARHGDGC